MQNQGIRTASTLVVCYQGNGWPYEVLLIKRSLKSKFLPGAHVFPGGSVDEIDKIRAKTISIDHTKNERLTSQMGLDPKEVSTLICTAIRETIEETGLYSFALDSFKSKTSHPDNLFSRYPDQFFENAKGQISFNNFFPLSWWVTPKGEARRFSTWFFMTLIPKELPKPQNFHESPEAYDPIWLSPAQALEQYKKRKIFLAPPTRSVLERMQECKNFKEFLATVDHPIRPIHPFFSKDKEGSKILVLPGDPLHPEPESSNFPTATRYQFP